MDEHIKPTKPVKKPKCTAIPTITPVPNEACNCGQLECASQLMMFKATLGKQSYAFAYGKN